MTFDANYYYSMYVKPETGLLYFLLARSTHVVDAYKEGKDIVVRCTCSNV